MDLFRIAIRALFAFVVLHALLRASGKRTLAQGTAFDFVLALVLGDMVDDLLWAEVPAARFTVAVGTLALAHVLVSAAALRSEAVLRWINGEPVRLLERGEPRPAALRAERVNTKELAELLRLHGLTRERWPEVEIGRLEPSGHLSLTRPRWARPASKEDRPSLRGRKR